MKTCEQYKSKIEAYLAQELPFVVDPEFEDHLDTCDSCRSWVDFHRELCGISENVPTPSNRQWEGVRRSVLAGIQDQSTRPATKRKGFWPDFLRLLQGYPSVAFSLLTLLIIGAVWVGRMSVGSQFAAGRDRTDPFQLEDLPVSQVFDSKYNFSQVLARPINSGKVELSFNVSRRVNIDSDLNSNLTKTVLLQAILDPTHVGTRIKAMALAPRTQNVQLRDALIYTLRNDPSLVIRLEALSALILFPEDPEIQGALMDVLKRDPEYQLRLSALETLVHRHVDRAEIVKAIEEKHLEGDAGLKWKAAQNL